nr:MAG TPA: hypothetical protein [Caudoviricetes sp.]
MNYSLMPFKYIQQTITSLFVKVFILNWRRDIILHLNKLKPVSMVYLDGYGIIKIYLNMVLVDLVNAQLQNIS